MNRCEAFAAIAIGMLIGGVLTAMFFLNILDGTYTQQSIVNNTQACFYLDEDHERKFSWDCSEKDE